MAKATEMTVQVQMRVQVERLETLLCAFGFSILSFVTTGWGGWAFAVLAFPFWVVLAVAEWKGLLDRWRALRPARERGPSTHWPSWQKSFDPWSKDNKKYDPDLQRSAREAAADMYWADRASPAATIEPASEGSSNTVNVGGPIGFDSGATEGDPRDWHPRSSMGGE